MGTNNATTGIRTYLQAHTQFQRARKAVHDAKSLLKEKFDAKLHDQPVYEPGQQVWLNIKNVGIRHPAFRGKLIPKYVGPLTVLKMVGRNAIKLELPPSLPIHPTFSTILVKPYFAREGITEPLFRNLDQEPEWEVDSITSHKFSSNSRKTTLFKVKWTNTGEDSWHELNVLENAIDTVERYLLNVCSKAVRRRILQTFSSDELAMLSPSVRAAI